MNKPKNPKVLIIIEHGLYSPWKEILLEGQLQTWVKENGAIDVDVVHGHARPVKQIIHAVDQFLYSIRLHRLRKVAMAFVLFERFWKFPLRLGRWSPSVIEKTIQNTNAPAWQVQMPDLAILTAHKTLSLLIHASNYDYDFVITTTSSSYINIGALYAIIRKLPKLQLVSGRFVPMPEGGFFPSGAFRIFSRDVLKIIGTNRSSCVHWIPEDVALGRLLQDQGLNFIELRSMDLPSIKAIDQLSKLEAKETVHFRCKSGALNNRQDTSIMLALHKKLSTGN